MSDQKDNKSDILAHLDDSNQVFFAGSPMSFVFNKIKKLASAIYLVTGSWVEKEPLKWSLRNKSICLLEALLKSHEINQTNISGLGAVPSRVVEIVSELELSFTASLVSEMNMRILKGEYLNLISFLKNNHLSNVYLPQSFFEVGTITGIGAKESYKKDLSGPKEDVLYKGHQGHIKDKTMSFINKNKTKALGQTPPVINRDRREIILKVIKNKGEISVKDVALVIKGVSEKTIQRELIAMSDEGVLKKSGERRWSRYSLAK